MSLLIFVACGVESPRSVPPPVSPDGTDAGGLDAATEMDVGVMMAVDAGAPEGPSLAEVQSIIDRTCMPCHRGARPAGDLSLVDFLAATVHVPSQSLPSLNLVQPSSADESYLVQKIRGTMPDRSSPMPPPRSPSPVPTADEIQRIAAFVDGMPP